MLQALTRGAMLRCPNCGHATISDSLWTVNQECRVCHVIFERKSGESAGASIIWLSTLPIMALIIFFVMYALNSSLPVWLLAGIPVLFVLIIGVVGYRHVKGVWIGIAYLTGDVYADNNGA